MHMSWRERLVEQPQLWEFSQWPVIPLDSLPRVQRKGFLRNQRIVAQVLSGARLGKVARNHQLSTGRVSQLLERCLGGEATSPPALTEGLIPYRNLVERQRITPLPRLHNTHNNGTAAAFRAVLKAVPAIQQRFDEIIEPKLKDQNYAQSLTPQSFHKEFQKILAEHHWPADQYPYTTASLGYQSVRRYLHARTAELKAERQRRHSMPVRNLGGPPPAFRAQRATQIDEHVIDLGERVHLLLDDQLIPLRIGRASVLAAVDVDTMCRLGYYLAPTRTPNQQDMLTLIERCLRPWQMELMTPGLSYAPGACFPSSLDSAFPVSFGTVQFDNALMHQARSVGDVLAQQTGATLNFGFPDMPEVRHRIESVFDYISEHISHRFASTTGSHPTDPIKESRKNRKQPPAITFQTLDEALSVMLTEDNITPRSSLGSATPLALYQDHCANHFVRFAPPWLTQQWQPFISSVEVALHWYSDEQRYPHVIFYYERYQGPGLMRVADKTKQIRVVFDWRDIRTLQAYTLEGEALGEVHAPRPWLRYPHSVATRVYIHKHTQAHRLGMRDPLGNHFRYLLGRRGHPDMALSLLRVYTEFTADHPEQGLRLNLMEAAIPEAQVRPGSGTYTWNADLANHRD